MKLKNKVIAGGAVATCAYTAGTYMVVKKIFNLMFPKWEPHPYSLTMTYKDMPDPIPRRPVSFFSGANKLQGYVYGEENTKGLIVFSHGILSWHEDYLSGIAELVRRGYTVFAYNNTGSADSEGKDARGLVQGVLDLDAALDYVNSDPSLKDRKRFLYGHSQGGYSVCAVLNLRDDVDGVISVSGFSTPMEVTEELGRLEYGETFAKLVYPMVKLFYRKRFGKLANLSAIKGINKRKIPVFIMHGIGDTYVNFYGAGIINHKNKIKNPRVRFKELDYPERTGHEDMFISLPAKHYVKEIDEKVRTAMKEHNVTDKFRLPKEVLDEIYSDVDRVRASEVNKELFDEIDDYFSRL